MKLINPKTPETNNQSFMARIVLPEGIGGSSYVVPVGLAENLEMQRDEWKEIAQQAIRERESWKSEAQSAINHISVLRKGLQSLEKLVESKAP